MRNISLLTICAAAMMAFITHAGAQAIAPDAGLESYAKARTVLDEGVAAIGGATALNALHTVRRDLVDKWVDGGQAQHPRFDPPDAQDAPENTGFADTKALSFLDYAGNRFLYTQTYVDSPTEYAVVTDVVTAEAGFESITYVKEKPYLDTFDAAGLPAQRVRSFRRYPEGLLRMALARPETLGWVGTATEGGHTQDVISFSDGTGTRVFLYFDSTTHLLTKAETLRGHPFFGDTTTEVLYSNYRREGPLTLPTRLIDRTGSHPTHFIAVTSTMLDASLPAARFQPPTDFVAFEHTPDEPTLEKISDTLYAIRGDYNVMFAVFRDYVMVFEAPISSAYAEKCLALVHATAPGKPVRYLLSTHYHYDHIAGVKPYIAAGATIVTTPDAKAIIEGAAATSSSIRPDLGARLERAPVIETVSEPRTFDDGTERVQIFDVGPAPHVAQMLVAYFPKEKILYVADLVDVLTTKLVIAGVDSVPVRDKIDALGLDVERIIPVHGVPITGADFRNGFIIRAKYAR